MKILYPETLPVSQKRDEILEVLQHNQVTIIAGDTGSGKTTQLPKMCLELLGDADGIVGCTQPRRVAALTVSQRVKDELAVDDSRVGYKIRFYDSTTDATTIKFMTDGVLLAEARTDKLLRRYKFLIIDEAHERSLNIDFIIGHIKQILPQRDDLKIIITSATIDTEAFSKHFDNAPVIQISGKSYPIEVRYAPPVEDEYGEPENYIERSVETAYQLLMTEPPGDMLIFLPTERDIRSCCALLHKRLPGEMVLPLYGRMHAADQKKIFKSFKQTKVVVATNVAETSITVPGIRYVIDTGLARIAQYNHRSKTNSLPIKKISKANCEQRKGRCGRVGPGVCIRLYSEDDYDQREEFSLPEIKRSNLSEVILQMLSFNLGNPANFPFIDPPLPAAVKEGFQSLMELGALDTAKRLTRVGRIMASLPIDPAISRVIIEANENGCLKEIMVIATVLAIQDPRIRPADQEAKADKVHEQFLDPKSDFLTLLNIWNLFHHVKSATSWSRLKKFCISHYLSFQRMREWIDLHAQMRKILRAHQQFAFNDSDAHYDEIHKSLAVGFLRNIGHKKKGNVYQGSAAKEFMIFPGSGQFNKSGQWILASTFLETSRLYALNVAAIQPEWLEKLGGTLCKYSWAEPCYHKKSGQIIANEKVVLFGLVIIAQRKVNFGKTTLKNRKEARAIFIQSALIAGELQRKYGFLRHNLRLVQKWIEVEDRIRSRNILAEEQAIYTFYDEVLPDSVFDRSTLNKYLKKHGQKGLFLDEERIVDRQPSGQELIDFPEFIDVGGHTFHLKYVFDPASEEDGVTIRIPIELADRVGNDFFEWIVPGLLREKTTFLLKSLPKRVRKHLIPLNTTVDFILDDIDLYNGSFYKALADSIFKSCKLTVMRSDWSDQLPNHLKMRICLVDTSGKTLSCGRNYQQLLNRLNSSKVNQKQKPQISKDVAQQIEKWQKIETKLWEFDDIPPAIPLFSKSNEITGYLYPVITPLHPKSCVTITFSSSRENARSKNREGLRYLYRLQYPHQYKAVKKQCTTALSGPSSLWLLNLFSSKHDAVEKLLDCIIDIIFDIRGFSSFKKESFTQRLNKVDKSDFYTRGIYVFDNIMSLLRKRNEVTSEITRFESLAKQAKAHLPERYAEYWILVDEIVPENFFTDLALDEIEDLKRYLECLKIRITRAHSDISKDKKKAMPLEPHRHNLVEAMKQQDNYPEECRAKITEYAKMIHEFRISVFAPEIKTKFPISLKKLNLKWQEIQQEC